MDWKEKLEAIFDGVAFKKYRVKIDFATIEKKVSHLRQGDAITYDDLEVIACEELWPFNRYWMWPAKEQIDDALAKTWDLIIDPVAKAEQEIDMLHGLLGIFKNISLVSILLRFVWPEHYAIYSRPALKILRVERGEDDTEEYLNFIGELKILKMSLGLDRTADVDMVVWAVSQGGDEFDDIRESINERLPEELPISELLKHASSCPIRVAEAHFGAGDYQTAGFWTARAFERILRQGCIQLMGYVPQKTQREIGDIEYLIKCVCEAPGNSELEKTMFDMKKLRNSAIHIERTFNRHMAEEFMKGVRDVAERLQLTC
jgi:hypothetical protein